MTWNQIDVGTPTTDTSGNGEGDLDSQYSTGFAPGVTQLNVYVGPSRSNQDILSTINRWVTDNTSRQGSFSAGECELLAYASGFTGSLDAVLARAAAQGQSMFFSSGDTGAACPAIVGVNGVPAGVAAVNYPASSPNGISVGGTSVLSPAGPTESGYQVVVAGTVQTVGGTSASAPSWQGIWARAEGAHNGALGFAGPVIYSTEPVAAYHDITLGSNGFPAAPGWDYTTGRGTPDSTAFVNGA